MKAIAGYKALLHNMWKSWRKLTKMRIMKYIAAILLSFCLFSCQKSTALTESDISPPIQSTGTTGTTDTTGTTGPPAALVPPAFGGRHAIRESSPREESGHDRVRVGESR